jgi:hypothetical protein
MAGGMSAYLQRLLGRAAPGAAFAAMPPSVPIASLSSPLAVHDQRLGLPDFEAPVPSEFDEPKVGEAEPAIGGREQRRAGKAGAKDAFTGAHRSPPDLRLVGEKHDGQAETPTIARPVEGLLTTPPRIEASALMPGPLDIGASDLEPIQVPAANEENRVEQGQSATPLRAPAPAIDQPTPVPEFEQAIEADFSDFPVVTEDEGRKTPEFDLPMPSEPAGRHTARIMPPDVDGTELVPWPIALPSDAPEPDETGTTLRSTSLEQADRNGGEPPSVNIEQIVIDVHEAQQAQNDRQLAPRSPPVTAASASIIGPLPVRRSTVSLFGMRRR